MPIYNIKMDSKYLAELHEYLKDTYPDYDHKYWTHDNKVVGTIVCDENTFLLLKLKFDIIEVPDA